MCASMHRVQAWTVSMVQALSQANCPWPGMEAQFSKLLRPSRVVRACLTGVPVAHLVRLPVPHQAGAVVVKDGGHVLTWEGVGRHRNQEASLPHRSVPD